MHHFRIFSDLGSALSALLDSLSSYATSRFTRLLLSILSCGPVPRHIAIVMDGNRRYARERGLRVGRGHEAGFESLKGVSPCIKGFDRASTAIDSLAWWWRWIDPGTMLTTRCTLCIGIRIQYREFHAASG